jgi:hypothetical protein
MPSTTTARNCRGSFFSSARGSGCCCGLMSGAASVRLAENREERPDDGFWPVMVKCYFGEPRSAESADSDLSPWRFQCLISTKIVSTGSIASSRWVTGGRIIASPVFSSTTFCVPSGKE